MRGARRNLEDQVGGLIAHDDAERRVRKREVPHPHANPEGYPLHPHGTAAIRAERASDPGRRQVA